MTEIDMGNIVPKSPAEKQTQLHQADALSKIELGEPLIRPTHNKPHEINHLIETDIGTINTQFRKRLEIYTALLRLQKTGKDLSIDEKNTLTFWLSTLNNLDTYVENHHLGARTLKEKQLTAFEKVRDSLERGDTLMTIVLPTGVGKTVLFAEIVEAMAGKKPDSESEKPQREQLKTLVLVPTVDLVEQTKVRFSQFADTLTLSGKGHQSRLNADVTVMTYHELVAKVKSNKFDFSQYKLVIKDEEHHSRGPETSKAINTLSHAIQLGFTATPVDYEGLNIIHSMSVVEAVEDGLLADFKIRWVKTKFKLPKLNDQGRYDTSELNEKLNTTSRNRSVVQLHRERHLGTSAFAFCFSVDQVKALAAEFNKDGIVAAPVWGKMDEDLKKSLQARQAAGEISEEEAQQLFYENCYNTIRQKFEAGEIEVLCNVKALREGTDIARAKVCYRTAPGMSSVNAAQEAGRVLRLYNDEHAYIYEFIDQEDPNDLPPVSYAEIVGVTEVQAHKSDKQTSDIKKDELSGILQELKQAAELAPSGSKKKDTPVEKGTSSTIDNSLEIPDFEIIVDTQEILHIAQRNKLRREGRINAEGLHRLDYRALSKDYDLSVGTIMRYVHDLASQYTQSDIIKSGSYYFASDELLELLKERLELSKEYTSITWTDTDSGKLYATRSYFDKGQRKRLDHSDLPFVIRILSGQPAKFYDVEAARNYFDSIGYTIALNADKDGFAEVTQEDTIEHFGPVAIVASYLGSNSDIIQGLIDKHSLTGRVGITRSGKLTQFYSREKLALLLKEKMDTFEIVVDESGIYTDSMGTWASIGALARNLPVTRNLVRKIIVSNNIPRRTGTVANVPCELYLLENVRQILIDKGNISEHITDANGIYVASDGETYGSIRGLTPLIQASPEASGLNITLDNVKDFIDRYTESYNIVYLQGAIPSRVGNKKAKIYSYSSLLRAMTEQGYFERKRKTSK